MEAWAFGSSSIYERHAGLGACCDTKFDPRSPFLFLCLGRNDRCIKLESGTIKMNNNNDEESLEIINHLLERLHQADFKFLGSININIYKSGSQHVDKVENQYIGSYPQKPVIEGGGDLPEVLSTQEAMVLWQKVQQAAYVDDNYQPTISRTQAALLADAMAIRLGIREKWKVFEMLWNRKNMYRDYYEALNQKKSLVFQDELKKLLR